MTAVAMQRLVEVRVHGGLGAQFGRVHLLAVDSAAEAVQALSMTCKGFAQAMRDFTGPGFRVRVGSGAQAQWRDQHTMTLRLGAAERVDIVPVIHGRKRNGIGQIIVGAVITVIGYYTQSYDGGITMRAGIAMMLGGVVALLTPMPRGSDSKAKEEGSRAINGPPNITTAGGPVPLLIGRMLIGSVTISAGLATDETPIVTADPGPPALPVEEPATWIDDGGSYGI